MCDSTNFHNIFFDSNNPQPGLFTHPCMSEVDIKSNRKMASEKDGIAMMTLARQNQVGTVMLHGVPIVCLYIEGQERLCLAQISNTLLKEYSYNEIHNRRVALGITCLQCTPVQLEILRRAGAMPVSSRRCGLITKREAERLVKSFLEDITPPQLPEDFKFEVYHECGWGSRGSFQPSRYNSSRAKCIECHFCKGFFSPNKFIFHYHRAPTATYRHPDAANFNSWRRHLKLCDQTPSDSLVHAWEDVKAMFNGGSRKRMLSSPMKRSSSPKMPNHATSSPAEDIGFYSFPSTSSTFPYYPYMSPMNDPLQIQRLSQGGMHPAFPRNVSNQRATPFQSYGDVLRSLSAPYTMMWMQQPTLPKPENLNLFLRPCDMDTNIPATKPAKIRSISEEHARKDIDQDLRICGANEKRAKTFDLELADSSSPDSECFLDSTRQHSSFKLGPTNSKKETEIGTVHTEGDKGHVTDDEGTIDVVAESQLPAEGSSEKVTMTMSGRETTDHVALDSCSRADEGSEDNQEDRGVDRVDSSGRMSEPTEDINKNTDQQVHLDQNVEEESSVGTDGDMASTEADDYCTLPIDELQRLLAKVRKARQHAEKRSKRLKGSLQDTLRREARIKLELTEQITAMRGTLCSEIEQEKRAKELIQHRLKEVHDALQNISYGLAPGQSKSCLCGDDQSEDSISET